MKKTNVFLEHAGESLESLVKKNKRGLSDSSAKNIITQLLVAVKTLHENGICHRDLKPDNVMVRQDDLSGYQVTLIDFNFSADISNSPTIVG